MAYTDPSDNPANFFRQLEAFSDMSSVGMTDTNGISYIERGGGGGLQGPSTKSYIMGDAIIEHLFQEEKNKWPQMPLVY